MIGYMSSTGLAVFDSTVQETNKILEDIEGEFDWQDRRDQAYDALRAVLQTLRDRLELNEAVDLAAQLPMLVKGIYYDGWKPASVPQSWNREEFLEEVRKKFPYSMEESTEDLIQGVMLSLSNNISKGEMQDVLANLPEDLKPIFDIE